MGVKTSFDLLLHEYFIFIHDITSIILNYFSILKLEVLIHTLYNGTNIRLCRVPLSTYSASEYTPERSDEFKNSVFGFPWRNIIMLRNVTSLIWIWKLAENYFTISLGPFFWLSKRKRCFLSSPTQFHLVAF